MIRRSRLALLAVLLACAVSQARADTIQASATTMILGRQDFRDGSTQAAVPAYEILNLMATDIRTPYADNIEVDVSTWGSIDLAERRIWQNGALVSRRYTGDVDVGFVRGDFLGRHLSIRVGRQMISDGVARMVQLDGAEARLQLPAGFGLQGYVGSPVAPRFAGRGGELVVGNIRATTASGGRLSWAWPGLLDLGASVAVANDRGDVSRQDVGVDFRLTPYQLVQLTGSSFWSLYENRLGEAAIAAMIFPVRHVDVTVDYRHVEPDLFLPRNSILAVFASDKRNDVGGAAHWGVHPMLALDGDYHLLLEDAGHGHRARLKATAHPLDASTTVGAEGTLLTNPATGESGNGYKSARLFAAKALREITGTLDLMGYFYDHDINGQPRSLTATATVAYALAGGWRATVAGTAGTTPYFQREFDIMAKLVYDQTYAVREVR